MEPPGTRSGIRRAVPRQPLSMLFASAPDAAIDSARAVLGLLEFRNDDRDLRISTLLTWLDVDGSANTAGAALSCNPNTMRYWLRRIEEPSAARSARRRSWPSSSPPCGRGQNCRTKPDAVLPDLTATQRLVRHATGLGAHPNRRCECLQGAGVRPVLRPGVAGKRVEPRAGHFFSPSAAATRRAVPPWTTLRIAPTSPRARTIVLPPVAAGHRWGVLLCGGGGRVPCVSRWS